MERNKDDDENNHDDNDDGKGDDHMIKKCNNEYDVLSMLVPFLTFINTTTATHEVDADTNINQDNSIHTRGRKVESEA